MTELQEAKPKNLLAIYDLSLDGQHDAKPVREAKDCEDLEGALQDLPDQGECCRLYIAGELESRHTFENHLRKILPLYKNSSSEGFNSLSTQWAKTKPSLHHALNMFIADIGEEPRLFDRRARDPSRDADRISTTCSICCHSAVDNALVIVINIVAGTEFIVAGARFRAARLFCTHESWRSSTNERYARAVFDRYIDAFLKDIQEYRHCQRTGHTLELRSQVYLLLFYRTALGLYEHFSAQTERQGEREYMNLFFSAVETHAWAKTAADASSYYNTCLNIATSISIVAKSLVSLVRETCTEQDLSPELKCLLAEVDSLSDGITRPFANLANRVARNIDMVNTSRNIQESRDSRLLNLLACIFLPASLATSLLSMSTRFVDLGPLLYDFCGVIVLFASFLTLMFLLLRVYQWIIKKIVARVDDNRQKMLSRPERYIRLLRFLLLLLLVIVWPVVLSCFVVGMVVDVSLGSRILGYGALAAVGVTLILAGVTRNVWMEIIRPEEPDTLLDELLFSPLVFNREEGVVEPASERQNTNSD